MSSPGTQTFADGLRAVIASSHLSLEAIQAALRDTGIHVGRSTLSFWQNGRRTPTGTDSLRAVAQLERVLCLAPGALCALLPDGRPVEAHQPGPSQRSMREILDQHGLCEVMDSWDIRVGMIEATIDAHRSLTRLQVHDTVRARRQTDRYVCMVTCAPDTDYDAVALHIHSSGRVARLIRSPQSRAVIAELELEQPAYPGEIVLLQLSFTLADHSAIEDFCRLATEHLLTSAVTVAFHPQALPVDITHFEKLRPDGPEVTHRPVPLGRSHSVSMVRERVTRGVHGFRWRWPEPDEPSAQPGATR